MRCRRFDDNPTFAGITRGKSSAHAAAGGTQSRIQKASDLIAPSLVSFFMSPSLVASTRA